MIRTRDQRLHSAALRPAERARSILATAANLHVGTLSMTHEVGRHASTPDGSLLFVAPADSPATVFAVAPRLPPQSVSATAVDVAPVPQPDRIRGSVRVTGLLGLAASPLPAGVHRHLAGPDSDQDDPGSPGPILQLTPSQVLLIDADGGCIDIDLPTHRIAGLDPLTEHEAAWLPHLQVGHADVVRRLADRAGGELPPNAAVAPLAVDRFGITLRVHHRAGRRDLRFDFTEPIACGCQVRAAFAEILARLGVDDPAE